MTETVAVVTANPPGAAHPARIGRVVPGRTIVLAHPGTGEPVPDGEPGAIRARGYATTFSEIIPSVYGISAAVPGRSAPAMSVGISVFELNKDQERLSAAVMEAAKRLADELH